jgi:hypothetical protein
MTLINSGEFNVIFQQIHWNAQQKLDKVGAMAIFIYDFNLEVLTEQIQSTELRRCLVEYGRSFLFARIFWELWAAQKM